MNTEEGRIIHVYYYICTCTVHHFPEKLTTGNKIFKFKMEEYDYSLFKSSVYKIRIFNSKSHDRDKTTYGSNIKTATESDETTI